jgi:RNA polymerase sigma-70 factor (ECF subfamily)
VADPSPKESAQVSDFSTELLQHAPALLARAKRLARDETQAEDLVQDTLVKALRARQQYQAGTNLRAWLLKILRNTFITRYHRKQLERASADPSFAEPLADGWIGSSSMRAMRDPEANALRPDMEQRIRSAVEELPQDFRQVVLLADVEGYAYREIAEELDCPIGTVMSRLYRARRQLRSKLQQHAIDLGLLDGEEEQGQATSVAETDSPINLEAFRSNSRRSS